jgi:peptidoglycan hydrolase CwlO-like protein
MNNADYLRDLANRLMAIPVMYGVDQGDVDRLNSIARRIEETQRAIENELKRANARLDDNLGDN